MSRLTEKTIQLVEYFEDQIRNVPAHEREEVLKRISSHISALNEDLNATLETFHIPTPFAQKDSQTETYDQNNLRDFI